MSKHKYWYMGAVTSFGKMLTDKWTASTSARSTDEARRNLLYQYKTKHNLLPNAQIELPGKIILSN